MKKVMLIFMVTCFLVITACSVEIENNVSELTESALTDLAQGIAEGTGEDGIIEFTLGEDSYSEPNAEDITGFLLAVSNGEIEEVEKYIAAGIDINGYDEFGNNALTWTMLSENTEMLQFLINNGLDLDAQDEFGNTALLSAVNGNSLEMIKILLEYGADPNIGGGENYDYYPLIAAAQGGHIEAVELLLQHGAYPNLAYLLNDDEVVDAQWFAETYGYTEIVELLKQAEME